MSCRRRNPGTAKAKELIFRAKRLSAAEAEQLGLVNCVVPEEELVDKAIEICKEIAANVRHTSYFQCQPSAVHAAG